MDSIPEGNVLMARVTLRATAIVRDKDGNIIDRPTGTSEVVMPLDEALALQAGVHAQFPQE